jgi:uncharacterized membrane protein YgcG
MTIEANSIDKFEVYVDAQQHNQVIVTVDPTTNYVAVEVTLITINPKL